MYEKEHLYYSFLDESSYREITGQDLSVENGTYYMIRNSSMYENQYNRYDDLDYVQNTYADIDKDMKFAGTVEYSSLATLTGFDGLARYVISDADYAELRQSLPDSMIVKNILFDVDDLDHSYSFARELYKQYCNHASEDMLKMSGYDEHQEEVSLAEDGYYGYADPVTPNPNTQKNTVTGNMRLPSRSWISIMASFPLGFSICCSSMWQLSVWLQWRLYRIQEA